MTTIGYHASHEQFKPSLLIKYIQQAERAGFTAALSSDHFYPWNEHQGESGFAWSWLGAALQASSLSFGVVNAPGQRYHPAIIAQAAATLSEMFPERFWVAVGSGQNMNEHITGDKWPAKDERNARLKECVDIMRAMFAGETVTHRGLVTVETAKLYTRSEKAPLLIGAAITPETAEWLGGWADGLLTTSKPPEEQKELIDAFHKGGGRGKPMYVKVQLSYSDTMEKAEQGALEEWRTNIFKSTLLADLSMPKQFEAAGEFVTVEDLKGSVRISNDPQQHVEWLRQDIELGFSNLYLHNVNREQEQFIEVFGQKVLPQLK